MRDLLDLLCLRARGLVVDPFPGSAAPWTWPADTGRRAIGVEADEQYAERAAERLCQGVLDFA